MQATITLKRLPLSLAIALGCSFVSSTASATDPLITRDGSTLAVTLDGQATTKTAEKRIVDSEGREAFTTFWSSPSSKGPHCFKITPQDKRLGDPERVTILIHEIRNDKPSDQWKEYQAIPDTIGSLADFSTEKGYCAKEFILTERLRYPNLPAGEYVVRVAYWGKGNWDRQDILLGIKD